MASRIALPVTPQPENAWGFTLGTTIEDAAGQEWVFIQAGEAIAEGQAVKPRLAFTLSGPSAVAGTNVLTVGSDTFTVEAADARTYYKVTTQSSPRRGALVHVYSGTGAGQIAIVKDVVSPRMLHVDVVNTPDGKWKTTLASASARVIDAVAFLTDTDDTDTYLQVLGVAQQPFAAGEFGFVLKRGIGVVVSGTTTNGAMLKVGSTDGRLEAWASGDSPDVVGKLISAPGSAGGKGLAYINAPGWFAPQLNLY
jgi:hypothetical protein